MNKESTAPEQPSQNLDGSAQVAVGQDKLLRMREEGLDPFRTNWDQTHVSTEAIGLLPEDEEQGPEVSVAGRIVAFRLMGKASFLKILDRSGKIQSYVRRDEIGEDQYASFKKLDLGDIIGIRGPLFRTKTGEVTIRAKEYKLVSKALRPLPEKWHGLTDNEQIYRQRYLDLIVNDDSRNRFRGRSQIIREIREFFWSRDFLEVETPMLQAVSGGAAARPFRTHFNALDCDFSMRIALELHLKRLLVGGFDRVFEVGRVFRNEGLSTKHNPEFTMMEWYEAYASMPDQMNLTKEIILNAASAAGCKSKITWDENEINLDNFNQSTLTDLVLEHNKDLSKDVIANKEALSHFLKNKKIKIKKNWDVGRMLLEVFHETVESRLIDPTFVTEYPVEVSPLSRRNQDNPDFADRFELFIGGKEFANGFCELNDPDDQASRFEKQVEAKDSGDKEAMDYDHDYITALEHGMPPAVGVGMGVDRLVMLLTNQSSIRDVLLFPQLKSNE